MSQNNFKRIGSIYKITNTINGKIYIGQTIQNVKLRWKCHRNDKKGIIRNVISKYGIDNIKFEEIYISFSMEDLNNTEERYFLS